VEAAIGDAPVHALAHGQLSAQGGSFCDVRADRAVVSRVSWVKAAAGAVSLGLAIEAGQYAVGLSAVLEWWDMRDDFLAVAGAAAVFGVWKWWSGR
jgi:hypothetical protein